MLLRYSLCYGTVFLSLLLVVFSQRNVPDEIIPLRWWDTIYRKEANYDGGFVDKNSRNFRIPTTPRATTPTPTTPPTTTQSPYQQCENLPGWMCVPYYICDGYEGEESESVNLQTGLMDKECPLHLEVCCHARNILTDSDSIAARVSVPDEEMQCGLRNENGISVRISGGDLSETQFGEFPWMVAVLRYETLIAKRSTKEVSLYICGGSLITTTLVLTAAHCVAPYASKTLKVRVGEWDTQQVYEIFPHQEMKVKNITIHPDFHTGALWNDVAVLHLKTPAVLAPHVNTICIPYEEQLTELDLTNCYASGWGKDKFDGTFQNILKKVRLDIVDHASCQGALRKTRLGKYFKLDDSFTCAGGVKGIDTCKGDGGAPLVCSLGNSQIFYQVGIVAWGIGCGEDGIPGVYAHVAKLAPWIDAIVFENQLLHGF